MYPYKDSTWKLFWTKHSKTSQNTPFFGQNNLWLFWNFSPLVINQKLRTHKNSPLKLDLIFLRRFRRRQSNPVGWMVGKVTDRNKNRSLKKANSLKGKRDDLIGQRQIIDASEAAEVSANRALGKKSSALSRFNLRKRRLHSEDIGNVNVNADLFRLRSISKS